MNTVLVAGGAGFLGSHLCRYLLSGNKVICVDNLITGRRANVADLTDNPNFSFIEQDIGRPLEIQGPVEFIYNMACPASPPAYAANAVETLMTCSAGFYNLLKFAEAKGARILQASTSEIYGNPLEHPQKETYFGNVNPVGERSCYDEGKRFAESLAINFGRDRGVSVAIARIFNTYGPGMRADDGRAVPNFISRALAGEDITIYGDGARTRSFCYVSDMVSGLISLMESGAIFPVNLGKPEETTISGLASLVIDLTGSQSKITYLHPPPDDPVRRCPDISLAREILGWEPAVGLREGLINVIEWHKSEREATS